MRQSSQHTARRVDSNGASAAGLGQEPSGESGTLSLIEGVIPGRRWVRGLVVPLLGAVCVCLSAVPAMAAATKAPEVGWLPASHVSTTGATIEVSINPEGGETSYEIWLECQNEHEDKSGCEPLTVGPQRQEGVLSAGLERQIVTDPVTGLQPGYLYDYRVVATNSAGTEGYVGDGFLTCPSEGSCPTQPFLGGESLAGYELMGREGREASVREAERESKQREEEERPAKEAAERAAWERKIREAGERAGREAAERSALADVPTCVVPRLVGDSLSQARRALGSAHCRLGRLTEPRHRRRALVVVKQGAHSGSKLAAGSRVDLTLARRKATPDRGVS